MSRAERRREMRGQEKKEVTRVMTIAQIQQMKKDMADLIADELLMKVVGIAALIIHDKFGMLMKKENSVATVREVPTSIPPMMVEPEREVPGMRESTWKQPILKAVR